MVGTKRLGGRYSIRGIRQNGYGDTRDARGNGRGSRALVTLLGRVDAGDWLALAKLGTEGAEGGATLVTLGELAQEEGQHS